MARKFLLVPSEAYRELLALSDTSGVLAGARGHMDQLMRSKKLNASAKNALYNQQLRGYLKLRKDTLERPVKVEIAGGPKLLVGAEGTTGAYTDATSEEPDEVVQETPEINLRPPTTQRTPAEQAPETPRGRPRRAAAKQRERDLLNEALERHFEKMAGIIQANRAAFNVDAQGQLLNAKGEPMRHSNFREALYRILQQDVLASSVGGASPVGTAHLRALLKRNPETKRLLTRDALLDSAEGAIAANVFVPSRPLGQTFRPDLWNTVRF